MQNGNGNGGWARIMLMVGVPLMSAAGGFYTGMIREAAIQSTTVDELAVRVTRTEDQISNLHIDAIAEAIQDIKARLGRIETKIDQERR